MSAARAHPPRPPIQVLQKDEAVRFRLRSSGPIIHNGKVYVKAVKGIDKLIKVVKFGNRQICNVPWDDIHSVVVPVRERNVIPQAQQQIRMHPQPPQAVPQSLAPPQTRPQSQSQQQSQSQPQEAIVIIDSSDEDEVKKKILDTMLEQDRNRDALLKRRASTLGPPLPSGVKPYSDPVTANTPRATDQSQPSHNDDIMQNNNGRRYPPPPPKYGSNNQPQNYSREHFPQREANNRLDYKDYNYPTNRNRYSTYYPPMHQNGQYPSGAADFDPYMPPPLPPPDDRDKPSFPRERDRERNWDDNGGKPVPGGIRGRDGDRDRNTTDYGDYRPIEHRHQLHDRPESHRYQDWNERPEYNRQSYKHGDNRNMREADNGRMLDRHGRSQWSRERSRSRERNTEDLQVQSDMERGDSRDLARRRSRDMESDRNVNRNWDLETKRGKGRYDTSGWGTDGEERVSRQRKEEENRGLSLDGVRDGRGRDGDKCGDRDNGRVGGPGPFSSKRKKGGPSDPQDNNRRRSEPDIQMNGTGPERHPKYGVDFNIPIPKINQSKRSRSGSDHGGDRRAERTERNGRMSPSPQPSSSLSLRPPHSEYNYRNEQRKHSRDRDVREAKRPRLDNEKRRTIRGDDDFEIETDLAPNPAPHNWRSNIDRASYREEHRRQRSVSPERRTRRLSPSPQNRGQGAYEYREERRDERRDERRGQQHNSARKTAPHLRHSVGEAETSGVDEIQPQKDSLMNEKPSSPITELAPAFNSTNPITAEIEARVVKPSKSRSKAKAKPRRQPNATSAENRRKENGGNEGDDENSDDMQISEILDEEIKKLEAQFRVCNVNENGVIEIEGGNNGEAGNAVNDQRMDKRGTNQNSPIPKLRSIPSKRRSKSKPVKKPSRKATRLLIDLHMVIDAPNVKQSKRKRKRKAIFVADQNSEISMDSLRFHTCTCGLHVEPGAEVDGEQGSIQCGICGMWSHIKCMLLDKDKLEAFQKGQQRFMCWSCIEDVVKHKRDTLQVNSSLGNSDVGDVGGGRECIANHQQMDQIIDVIDLEGGSGSGEIKATNLVGNSGGDCNTNFNSRNSRNSKDCEPRPINWGNQMMAVHPLNRTTGSRSGKRKVIRSRLTERQNQERSDNVDALTQGIVKISAGERERRLVDGKLNPW